MIAHRTIRRLSWLAALSVLATGCGRDDLLIPTFVTGVAVTAGDFDHVAEPLNRMDARHSVYEGIISTATWDPGYQHEQVALKVETLLGSENEIAGFDAAIIASGTRGLGLKQYNGLEADDHLVSNEVVVDNVRTYVDNGNTLVATDWAYDLVEAAWPEFIDFYGDDTVYDAAQRGEIGRITADVVEADLAAALESDQMGLHYNFSNWAVIESVSDDVTVLVRGTVQYRPDAETVQTLEDVPLMVGFRPRGGSGKVIFTTFHLDAQNDALIDRLVETTVGTFEDPEGENVEVR